MGATGRLDEAHALLDAWLADTPEHFYARGMRGNLYAWEGRRDEYSNCMAEMRSDEQRRSAERSDPIGVLWGAEVYAMHGEIDEALEWLEHGLELGLINYPFLAEKAPLLESLRSDPRFQKLMVRVKKEWEEFEG